VKPLCIDLFCGLGGWTEGFLAEGYEVVGFDIERHVYGEQKYPAQLVLQDVLTIHGSQFRNAACIVCSPPCQKYSWLAMPWSRSKSDHSKAAKALRREWETNGPDNRLFDVPALMPINLKVGMKFNPDGTNRPKGSWFRERNGVPQPGIKHEDRGVKVESLDGGRRTDIGKDARFTSRDCGIEGTKIGGDWFSDPNSTCRKHGSRSKARKMASAQIAKIPLPLSQHIASVYKPRTEAAA